MSDFKTKMHQIRFRLGLLPRPRWGSLQRSARPPGFGGVLLRDVEERGRKGKREGKWRIWKGRGLSLPKVNFLVTSLVYISQKMARGRDRICENILSSCRLVWSPCKRWLLYVLQCLHMRRSRTILETLGFCPLRMGVAYPLKTPFLHWYNAECGRESQDRVMGQLRICCLSSVATKYR